MKGRGVAVLRALGACVLLLLLVVGVPALLILIVGNPFPSSMPTINEIRILLTQNGEGFANFIVGVLAVIIWFIWAQLIVALIVEIVATIQHNETRRLPTAPGIQIFAAKMVAAITLATTIATAPILAPAVGALSFGEMAPVASVVNMATSGAPTTMVADAFTAGVYDDSAADLVVDQVAPRVLLNDQTELWDLAEAAYGDGLSWKIIAEANAGLIDAQGVVVTGDTEVVPSGTELVLPGVEDVVTVAAFGFAAEAAEADGDVAAPSLATSSSVQDTTIAEDMHIVEPGDSMWTISEDAVAEDLDRDPTTAEVAEYWSDVVASNESLPSGDADLIHPGDELVMPSMADADNSALSHAGFVEPQALADADADADADDAVDVEVTNDAGSGDLEVEVVLDDDVIDLDDNAALDDDVAGAELADEAAAAELADDVAGAELADEVGVVDLEDEVAGAELADEVAAAELADDGVVDLDPQAEDDLLVWVPADAPQDQGSIDDSMPAAAIAGAGAAQPGVFDGTVEFDDDSLMDDIPMRAVGLAALGSAILLTGVTGAVRRRRALQRRMRPAGAVVPTPPTEAAAFAAAVEHASHHLQESEQGYGWRMLPAQAVTSLRAAGPLQIHIDESGRLFALAVDQSDTSAVHHFDLDSATSVAILNEETELDLGEPDTEWPDTEWPDETVPVAPTTLVAGTDTANGDAVLIDLASVGELTVDGDETSIRRFTRSAVLDLATSERADDVCVIAVNVAREIKDLDRVRCVDSYAEALAEAVGCGHGSADSETPVVVVAASPPDANDDSTAALRELGACIVGPGLDESSQITVDGQHAVLEPSGTFVVLAALDDDGYDGISELVEVTKPHVFEWPESDVIAVEDVLDVPAATSCPVEAGSIEVKVLGPVEIAGAEPFSSLKAIDVITYLAFHRHGADADQLKTWVWPPFDPPTDKALANVLSRARTGLGTTVDGAPYLSKAGTDKTYRLDPSATTDFDRFRAVVELANNADTPQETLGLYKQAIELIRGVPFTGGSASSFAWTDNHVRAMVEFTIDETVHKCADLALELGDLQTARWAALKGLELVPGCEQCFRRRFLVAEAGNNRSELRRAMADLERSAAIELGEPEAVDTISEELLDLYHQLDRALVAGSV